MRILSAEDVRAAVSMPDAIDAVRAGFVALSTGRASVPLRTMLPMPDGLTLYMPAHIHGEPISVVKVVSVYPNNPARDLPTIIARVLVLDADTGQPLAMMDGTSLTALRTGAASGLATDLLARPESAVLGVIGAGAQARTQVEAVCAVRPIVEIRIYSPTRAQAMAEELRARFGTRVVVTSDAHQALIGADVIVAATNSKSPVIHVEDVSPGTHINGVGSFTPEMQEIGPNVVSRARVIVDHRESAWAEAGDLIIPRDQGIIPELHAQTEIGEVAAGMAPGRETPDQITFFKSVGNAVQDAAVAARVLSVAEERGLGQVVKD
jgi:ornithine cyclodeaminase/alanine dehydrogenase-like protein (mu-crystallin family)